MKRFVLFLVAIGIIASFHLVLAQKWDGGPHPGPMMERMLDLTDEQQAKIEDLKLNFQKEKLPLRSKIHELRANLKLELTKESFDESKVNQTIDQIEALRTEMHKKRINHQRAVRNVLNDEQKKKFDMHILSGRKSGGKGFGHCGMPHPSKHKRQFRD